MVTPLGKEAFDIFFGNYRSSHSNFNRKSAADDGKEQVDDQGTKDLPFSERNIRTQGDLIQLMRHWNSFIMNDEKEWLELANKH
ncbi:hypothetical protein GUITHDRAFT_156174 [Guillardia theta CCMP2712]|uniref:Uncharacterized protein n=1 Tax=Guillardia theta (strain CCMP2712) TaxID=905079 RepID=L1IAV9_GUITC|nr:hypothetical protein GUITHDRAFT_156174 [Guillardia theta CCMP2712]EKX33054.1 hypothetical protein GUITHDRAFT_156174 [Guillardia theta CCMP2712]|mmetsp:Transcript_42517/g.133910  ORF Transcript_42517/g.133910 Transcript_42517/m.133910 type:complete len:84 (-) Transcript_42517:214-465(-)|eukprot:XP_005820034.1 hypothetical protein GUITHDRAFT_156174 [Guillardia theta CCMP2712]